MKTKAKLFSLLLVLALLAVGLVIGIAAADEGEATIPEGYVAYTDEVNGITALKATLSGAKWLIYPTEADFIADKEDNGFIDGTGATAKTNNFVLSSGGLVSNGGKYVYLLEDATHTGAATINFYNNTFKLDLGGNKLSVTLNKNGNTLTYLQIAGYKEQDLYNASYCDFTICNGEVVYSSYTQFFTLRPGAVFTLRDVTFTEGTAGVADFLQDGGAKAVTFDNVTFDFGTTRNQVVNRRGSSGPTTDEATEALEKDADGNVTKDTRVETVYTINDVTVNPGSKAVNFFIVNYSHATLKAPLEKLTVNVTGNNYFGANGNNGVTLFSQALSTNNNNSTEKKKIYVYACNGNTDFVLNIHEGIKTVKNPVEDMSKFSYFATERNAVEGKTTPNDYLDVANYISGYNKFEINYYDKNGNKLSDAGFGLGCSQNGDVKSYEYGVFQGKKYEKALVNGYTTYSGSSALENVVLDFYGGYIDYTTLASNIKSLKLYGNVEFVQGGKGNIQYSNNVTIDLNKNTLTMEKQGTVGRSFSVPVDNVTLTIKNGNVNVKDIFFIANGSAGNVEIEGVTVTATGAVGLLQFNKGKITVTNSILDSSKTTNNTMVNAGVGADQTGVLTFNNVQVYGGQKNASGADTYYQFFFITPIDNSTTEFNFINSTFDAYVDSHFGFRESGDPGKEFDKVDVTLNITGCNFKSSGRLFNLSDGRTYELTENDKKMIKTNISDSYFRMDFMSANKPTVNFGGQAYMPVSGVSGYKYVVAKPTNTAMYANLSLYSDFTLNLFVPVENNIVSINDVKEYLKGEDGKTVIVPVNGVDCYVYQVPGIAPTNAAEKIALDIVFTEGKETRTLNAKYSVVNYAKDYLKGTTTTEGEALIKDTLAYVKAATVAYNANLKEGETARDLTAVNELLVNYDRTVTIEDPNKTLEGNEYFTGATFDVGTEVTLLVFNLNTGNVTAETKITVNGIEAELVGKQAIIELRAFMLADEFNIYVDGKYVGTYSLAAYYNSDDVQAVVAQNEIVDNLVKALYAYAESAKAYKATV